MGGSKPARLSEAVLVAASPDPVTKPSTNLLCQWNLSALRENQGFIRLWLSVRPRIFFSDETNLARYSAGLTAAASAPERDSAELHIYIEHLLFFTSISTSHLDQDYHLAVSNTSPNVTIASVDLSRNFSSSAAISAAASGA